MESVGSESEQVDEGRLDGVVAQELDTGKREGVMSGEIWTLWPLFACLPPFARTIFRSRVFCTF